VAKELTPDLFLVRGRQTLHLMDGLFESLGHILEYNTSQRSTFTSGPLPAAIPPEPTVPKGVLATVVNAARGVVSGNSSA